jgi:voltage-gated potassium channel
MAMEDASAAQRAWVHIVVTAVRAVVTASVLIALYYVLPLDDLSGNSAVAGLAMGVLIFLCLVGWQVGSILRSSHPETRALQALVVVLPLFILLFASAYYVMGRAEPADFSEALTRSDALYFTVTIFSTVGFGDVSAQGETTRLVVTAQMILDLIFLGVGIRVILGAVQKSKDRSASQATDEETASP